MSRGKQATFLIVDGNNIIHAWPDLLTLHRNRRGLAHTELCQRLREVHDSGDYRVVVVFDGRGSQINEEREPKGLQIIYSDGDSTADDIIERLSARHAAKHRLIVATDDLAEQNLVAAMGAETLSARGLRELVDANEGQWRRWV